MAQKKSQTKGKKPTKKGSKKGTKRKKKNKDVVNCPYCGTINEISLDADKLECSHCGYEIVIGEKTSDETIAAAIAGQTATRADTDIEARDGRGLAVASGERGTDHQAQHGRVFR